MSEKSKQVPDVRKLIVRSKMAGVDMGSLTSAKISDVLNLENVVDYHSSSVQEEIAVRVKLGEWRNGILNDFLESLDGFLKETDSEEKRVLSVKLFDIQSEVKHLLMDFSGDELYQPLVDRFQFLADAEFTEETLEKVSEVMVLAEKELGGYGPVKKRLMKFDNNIVVKSKEEKHWSKGGEREWTFLQN